MAVTPFVAGNWKMFKTPSEAHDLCRRLAGNAGVLDGVRVAVCPPYVSLAEAVRELAGTGIEVFAQSVHWEPSGAFTGEISAGMLLEVGATGAIVGHSERRQLFGETDESVAQRARYALESGLDVIACVGETAAEREADATAEVLRRQVGAIADVVGAHARLTVAYEPVWAIGTGKTATPAMAEEAHGLIRSRLDVPALYGGSVKPENAGALLAQPNVDGALVGGASLEAEPFLAICEAAARTRS
jgi:triosephosphate isomerase